MLETQCVQVDAIETASSEKFQHFSPVFPRKHFQSAFHVLTTPLFKVRAPQGGGPTGLHGSHFRIFGCCDPQVPHRRPLANPSSKPALRATLGPHPQPDNGPKGTTFCPDYENGLPPIRICS